MAADKVTINDLELHLCIGVSEEERSFPQKLLLSVKADVDSSTSALTGNLSDTVSYSDLARSYTSLSKSKSWVLLEELLEEFAATTLENYPLVTGIQLKVKKFIVPQTASTGIEITRYR